MLATSDSLGGMLRNVLTTLLPRRARLYHYHMCVVVVHSCLCQALIKHEWGAFLANVGQVRSKLSTSHTRHWKQSLAGLALPRGQTACSGYSPTIIMLRIHYLILKNANKFRWLSLSGGSSSHKLYNIFIFHFFCVYIKRLFLFLNKRIVFCIEHN